jgi:glycosyltransferase involved in cell wall biosynthesis
MKSLSVIICTHNPRANYLQRTLAALQSQTLPLDRWELLLIDNASQPPVADKLDLAWHPHARHLREDKVGKLNAWLLGIKESNAEVLIFVDDDNVLAADYLETALVVAGDWPFVGTWGGSIIPEFESPLPSWCGAEVWRLAIVDVKEDIWSNLKNDFTTMPVGAGMCVRRKVAERYVEWCVSKPVSASLDRSGTGLAGYGDIDLAHCAVDVGLGTGKSKNLRLTHLISSSRLTLDYFKRHAEGDAVSEMMFRAVRGFPIQKPKPMSLVGRLRWFIHRLKNRVPRERFEVQKAHRRGSEKGYKQAMEYLDSIKRHP